MEELEEQFTKVYKKNIWKHNESKSGTGSDIENTRILRTELLNLINKLNIRGLVDASCGDYNWMKEIISKMNLDYYIGIDIVKELIDNLNNSYSNSKISFMHGNIVSCPLPKGDLLLCRDCLVHLSFENIFAFLENFKKSDIPYLLTTTFTNENRINTDVLIKREWGIWRPLNLQKPPLNFPKPIIIINEGCTEGDNLFTDKSLGLWKKEDLK